MTETYIDGSTVRRKIIYLSGPMTGIENWNGPAFERYAAKLRADGYEVVSPWEMDEGDHAQPYRYYIGRDLSTLLDPCNFIEAIFMMPGWEKSKGACLERHAAEVVGIAVYDAETGQRLDNWYVTP